MIDVILGYNPNTYLSLDEGHADSIRKQTGVY